MERKRDLQLAVVSEMARKRDLQLAVVSEMESKRDLQLAVVSEMERKLLALIEKRRKEYEKKREALKVLLQMKEKHAFEREKLHDLLTQCDDEEVKADRTQAYHDTALGL